VESIGKIDSANLPGEAFCEIQLTSPPINQLRQAATLAAEPLELVFASYYQEHSHNSVLLSIAFAGHWHIIDGYLSWEQCGRLSQTCKGLSSTVDQRMNSKLLHVSQLVVAKHPNDRAVLIKEFQNPCNRVAPHILITPEDVRHIQQGLGINCGPNMLIAIKNGYLTPERAKQRLQDSREPMQALRSQFAYLDDAQFLVLQKYCVDEFFLVEDLIEIHSEEEIITMLAQQLTVPKVQFYLDCIALESNQPVQIKDVEIFFIMLHEPKIFALLEDDVLAAAQLLTVTHHRGIDTLCNEDLTKLVLSELISVDQWLMLSELNFREPDEQIFKLLAVLMQRPEQPLQAAQFFKLHITGQQLLCTTTMCSLIQSDQIPLDEFLALNEVNQQKLHAYWKVLAPLTNPERLQPYTLKKLVEVITDDINFKVLSTLVTRSLTVLGRLPIESLLAFSDTDKKRLSETDILLEIFISSDEVNIIEFFKLPCLNQQFLETNWWDIWDQLDNQKLTWDQIKNSSPDDLAVFEHSGMDEYVAHINHK